MNVEEIQKRAESIFEEYDANFAGKPRATRDLELLDDLIERLEEVLESARAKLNGGRNEALVAVIEQGTENLEIYRRERRAIQEVQEGGEGPVRASRLATWANAEFHRYRRHFAGKDRATRDEELINEMISELKQIHGEMSALNRAEEIEGLPEDIETVEENLNHYRDERERIITARKEASLDEQASYLAIAANEQFAIYADLFAGKNRVTRRPKLLRRVVRSLENIQRRMEQLAEKGLEGGQNEGNIEVVEDNLSMYREELEEIEEARSQHDPDELASELGGAANEVFEQYRQNYAGKDRAGRDLEQLGRMCDELYHVARQMEELGDDNAIPMNAENLAVVLDNLSLYQREYDAVEEARESNSVESR